MCVCVCVCVCSMNHSVRIWLQISGLTPANWSRMCFYTRSSMPIKAPQDWRRRFRVEPPGMNTPPSRGTLKDWAPSMLGLLPWSGTRDTGKPLWDQTALYVMSADKTMHLSQVRAGFWLHCCCRRPSPRYCAWQQSSSPVSLPDTRSSAFAEPVSPENLGNMVITLVLGVTAGVKQNWVRTTPTVAPEIVNQNTQCWLRARKAECSRLAGWDVLWYLGHNRHHRNV